MVYKGQSRSIISNCTMTRRVRSCALLSVCWLSSVPQHVTSQEEGLPQFRIYQRDIYARDEQQRRQLGLGSLLAGREDNTAPKAKYEGFGCQFMDIHLGTPAQKLTLAVQTGSDFMALPCANCGNACGSERKLFNNTLSSTFRVAECNACSKFANCQSASNGESVCSAMGRLTDVSRWTGFEAFEKAYVGGAPPDLVNPQITETSYAFDFKFACQLKTSGSFSDRVMDGVLSFSSSENSLLSQMQAAGLMKYPRFSLCFDRRIHGVKENTGIVTMGGYDPGIVQSPIVFAPNVPTDSLGYRIIMKRMHLRMGGGLYDLTEPGQPVYTMELPDHVNGGTLVDSGLPYLTLDARLKDGFLEMWKTATGIDFKFGTQDLVEENLLSMPTLLLEFEGHSANREIESSTLAALTDESNVLVAIPAYHYMEQNPITLKYRARIQFDGEHSILAANAMQGHNILYENDQGRIGFSELDSCSTRNDKGTVRNDKGTVLDSIQSASAQTATALESELTFGDESLGSANTADADVVVTSAAGTELGSTLAAGARNVPNDDDLFLSVVATPKSARAAVTVRNGPSLGADYSKGSCWTVTCRSYLLFGYVAAGTALAVVYRIARPKEQLMRPAAELLNSAAGGEYHNGSTGGASTVASGAYTGESGSVRSRRFNEGSGAVSGFV